jgi:alanyl-tRNA synthetase
LTTTVFRMKQPFICIFRRCFVPKRYYSVTSLQQTTAEIRKCFLQYFQKNDHVILPSSPLIPENDTSLLFTAAGMVQFKDYFMGFKIPQYKRIATVQKCLRAGGKHNDLDNVGHTNRHLTFFEMLGNFSFGDYWKTEAIQFAWTFLTKELGIPSERLAVSVLESDEETADIWKKTVSLPESKIFRKGTEDNFWTMSEAKGPCGPCTEIFWDRGKEIDNEQYLEIWNLVFMQYENNEEGRNFKRLPTLCVDTGMGLERLVSVLQGKESNYVIDSLALITAAVRSLVLKRTKRQYSTDWETNIRVITDHLRASAFLISEGLLPGNSGRQYVLRRLIRRAVRCGHLLGLREPFMSELLPAVVESMADSYPELQQRFDVIKTALTQEEESFFIHLQRGLEVLDREFKELSRTAQSKVLPAEFVFKLHSGFGFPADLTELIAKERGWRIDLKGFEALLEQDKEKSRLTWGGSGDREIPKELKQWKARNIETVFTGYSNLVEKTATVLAVEKAENGDYWLCITPCPFYGESGGQVGDRGTLTLPAGIVLVVNDAIVPYENCIALRATVHNSLRDAVDLSLDKLVGSSVIAEVDLLWRLGVRRSHTATHLLHAALRKVVGPHVTQQGSRVLPDRLTFDFSHNTPLTVSQMESIERFVNTAITLDSNVCTETMSTNEAIASGAMALFREKYPENVRVVSVPGFSRELCGGTHVTSTGQIQCFKIVSQNSIGSNVRRIEALTGAEAVEFFQSLTRTLHRTARLLECDTGHLEKRLQSVLEEQKHLKRELKDVKSKLAQETAENSKSSPLSTTYHGRYQQRVCTLHEMNCGEDLSLLRQRATVLRTSRPFEIHILVSGTLVRWLHVHINEKTTNCMLISSLLF